MIENERQAGSTLVYKNFSPRLSRFRGTGCSRDSAFSASNIDGLSTSMKRCHRSIFSIVSWAEFEIWSCHSSLKVSLLFPFSRKSGRVRKIHHHIRLTFSNRVENSRPSDTRVDLKENRVSLCHRSYVSRNPGLYPRTAHPVLLRQLTGFGDSSM